MSILCHVLEALPEIEGFAFSGMTKLYPHAFHPMPFEMGGFSKSGGPLNPRL